MAEPMGGFWSTPGFFQINNGISVAVDAEVSLSFSKAAASEHKCFGLNTADPNPTPAGRTIFKCKYKIQMQIQNTRST